MEITWSKRKWITQFHWGQIHPNDTNTHYDSDAVKVDKNDTLELSIINKPKEFEINNEKIIANLGAGVISSTEEFGYGLFESEIKLASGDDLIEAFWLYTGPDYDYREVDIMEAWSGKNNYFSIDILKLFKWFRDEIRVIWSNGKGGSFENSTDSTKTFRGKSLSFKSPSKNFIKYGFLFSPTEHIFYRDDKVVRKITDENIISRFRGTKFRVIFDNLPTKSKKKLDGNETPMITNYFKFTPIIKLSNR